MRSSFETVAAKEGFFSKIGLCHRDKCRNRPGNTDLVALLSSLEERVSVRSVDS